jgi:photosystem II stability/assembly factor-like uncharacterized protein
MRTLCITLISILSLLSAYSQGWFLQNSNTSSRLNSVHFVDPNHGCAVGNDGTICTTSDGGLNWVLQSSGTTSHIRCVHFIDTLKGFAMTSSELLKTIDGGTNWIVQDTMDAEMTSIYFIDNDTGFVAGRGRMMKTTDGGQSWIKLISADMFTSCFWAINSNILYAGGMGGAAIGSTPTIAKSVDGGVSWDVFYQTGSYGSLNDLFFTSDSTAFLSADFFAQGNTTYIFSKTIDEGLSWTYPLLNINESLTSIFFTDSLNGYMASFNGSILKTTDAGENWVTQNANVTAPLLSVFFPDSLTGYAVGFSGTIIKTTTGGSIGINDLNGNESLIFYPNPSSEQLIIEGNNLIIHTSDILDFAGKTHISIEGNISTINIADLPQGIYLIQFHTDRGTITKKFVKQ